MSLVDLIPGVAEVKIAITVILVVAVLGGAGYVAWEFHEFKNAEADNVVLIQNNKNLQENNDTLKANFEKAVAANAANEQTIKDLEQERADSKKAIDVLAAEKLANLATLNTLHSQLGQLIKDPKNNGPVSVDLREVIRGIQNGEKK